MWNKEILDLNKFRRFRKYFLLARFKITLLSRCNPVAIIMLKLKRLVLEFFVNDKIMETISILDFLSRIFTLILFFNIYFILFYFILFLPPPRR